MNSKLGFLPSPSSPHLRPAASALLPSDRACFAGRKSGAPGLAKFPIFEFTCVYRLLFGAGLLAIPCEREDADRRALKPIVNDIVRLVQLQKIGLIKGPIRIGLSGPTGAGKSTLAEMLRDWIPNAKILHGDDFMTSPKHALPIHPGLDQQLATRVFTQLERGVRWIEKPVRVWDEKVGKRVLKSETVDTQGVDVWIIEFSYACFQGAYDFHRFAHFHVLLDAPTQLAAQWVWERARSIPKGTNKQEYLAEVTQSMERYKNYLKQHAGPIRYTVTPDAQHHFTLKKSEIPDRALPKIDL